MLPQEVMERIRRELADWQESGMSILEMPFDCEEFRYIAQRAHDELRVLLRLPENYHILFMQGGAYGHFALLAMNLLGKNSRAGYVQSGHWSTRAIDEAARYGTIDIIAGSKQSGFDHIPPFAEWRLAAESAYCHITTNETADGVQFQQLPDTGAVPLVADVTSDFLTRRMEINRFGMLYASAQKSCGVAGLTIVIIREELLDQAMAITPAVFNYGMQARSGSRINTPPIFSLYVAGLMFSWMLAAGGVDVMERRSRRKAATLYDVIDADELYSTHVVPSDRSLVNVCFQLPDAELESGFLAGAEERGLLNLKGHGAVGGIRASLYNAMPQAGAEALAAYMQEFSAGSVTRLPARRAG